FVRRNQETTRATGRIAYSKFGMRSWIRLNAADDRPDKNSRCEVLSRSFLSLACRLFEKAFEGSRLHIDIKRRPLGLVDQTDKFLEINRIVKAGLGLREDIA